MQEKLLLDSLLDLCDERAGDIAAEWKITPSSLSRHRAGRLRTRYVLRTASEWFSKRLGVAVDEAILQEPIDAKTILAVALHLRSRRLKPAQGA